MRREPRPRDCAIIVASEARWPSDAEGVLRDKGYAVAKLSDLHYADLLVAPRELRVLVVEGKMLRSAMAAHIARLRGKHPDVVVVVIGDLTREEDIKRALDGGGSIYVPSPFDADGLARVLPPAAPDQPGMGRSARAGRRGS